jgi:SRSO17 transposase
MTKRQAAACAPGPLEAYATAFDDRFDRRNAREAFHRYLAGLLLPAERTKTLTALANAELIHGIHAPRVQSLQWFLSESIWDAAALNADGVVVIDETGDHKWGTKTAHIGRQYLGNIGKVDSGVVSVSSPWADERVDWPLTVEPFTPKQHFAKSMSDPAYRTKPQIAVKLVQQAVARPHPHRFRRRYWTSHIRRGGK